ncbi:hypothetical protein ACQ4PT_024513 [Festuca glaucescens]
MNAGCEAPFKDRLAALLASEEGGVRCVITDVIWYTAQAVARDLGVPALGIMTASAANFRLYMAFQTLIDNAYLPVQGSVLYVSFGSLAAMDLHEFVELAWGLAASKRPFLWVVRPKLIRGFQSGELPDGLEEEVRGRGMIVSWAPQVEVLAHPALGAFFTHSGWNSTVEAMSEGVPMICHPLDGDQYAKARYVYHVWKVGVEVETAATGQLQREEIKAAIEKMVDDIEIRERMNGFKIAAEEAIKVQTDLTGLVDLIKSF